MFVVDMPRRVWKCGRSCRHRRGRVQRGLFPDVRVPDSERLGDIGEAGASR